MVVIISVAICVVILVVYICTKDSNKVDLNRVNKIISSLPISRESLSSRTGIPRDRIDVYLNIYARMWVAIEDKKSKRYKDKILSEISNDEEWRKTLKSIVYAETRKYYHDMVVFCVKCVEKCIPQDSNIPRIKYVIQRMAYILAMKSKDIKDYNTTFESVYLAIVNNDEDFLGKKLNMTINDVKNDLSRSYDKYKEEFEIMRELPSNIIAYSNIATMLMPHYLENGKRVGPLEGMMIIQGVNEEFDSYLKTHKW